MVTISEFALSFFTLILIACDVSQQVKPIDNSIAPPEIVHRIVSDQFGPQCTVVGKPLDLLFVLDSSGSLENKFQDELNVIKQIVNIVAIGEHSTRVALVQFSGVQRTEFHFNTFFNRRNVLQAVDTLTHVSGITKTGAALEYSKQELSEEHGMRGVEVPKLIFLLSDGRTHDYPLDKVWADKLRETVVGLDIWAYGTGDYVAIGELINITRDESKIVTNQNLHRIAELFGVYQGTEVCEEVPVCIPGSDKPLDLIFVVDGSDSVEGKFLEQINVIRQLLNNVNVHPLAVQVALIVYSGVRNSTVAKMAIVLTDGHSISSPAAFAQRLVQQKNVTVAAVAVSPENQIDPAELLGTIQKPCDHKCFLGKLLMSVWDMREKQTRL